MTPEAVCQIAERASSRRRGAVAYSFDTLAFIGASTNQALAMSWVAHFIPRNASPDLDFFVVVDETTGQTTIWP